MAAELRQSLFRAMHDLTPRQQHVLKVRYGLESGECVTLREIGEAQGTTAVRIRQIEQFALGRLRHPDRHRHLLDFVDRGR